MNSKLMDYLSLSHTTATLQPSVDLSAFNATQMQAAIDKMKQFQHDQLLRSTPAKILVRTHDDIEFICDKASIMKTESNQAHSIASSLYGIPVIIDESLPANILLRIVDHNNKILSQCTR